jgi:hypothetical protein
MRTVYSRMFNRLVTTGTGLGLQDTQCGFKAFRTPAARLLFHLVRIDRFAFDVEVLVRARRLGLRVAEVPVHWKHVPGSTIHPLHDSLTMLTDVYRSRLGLLGTPQVPGIAVGGVSTGRTGDGRGPAAAERIVEVASATLPGVPVPVVCDGTTLLVLLPLTAPDDVATLGTALRAELAPLPVQRLALSLDALVALGPLSGRLVTPPHPDPTP